MVTNLSKMIYVDTYSGRAGDVQLLGMTLNEYLIGLDRRMGFNDKSNCSSTEQLQRALKGRYQ